MTSSPPRTQRRVNFVAFLLTGVVGGFIVGAIVDSLGPAAPTYNNATSLAFLGVVGALIGGLLLGTVAVILDAVLARR